MALTLGQLLGGAGVVAGRQRQTEEAERVARQNQLAIEEQNRLETLRRMQRPDIGAAPGIGDVEQFRMDVVDATPKFDGQLAPPRPAAPAPAAAPVKQDTYYEDMYGRLKSGLSPWTLSRAQNLVGMLPEQTANTLALLKDPNKFSTEEVARLYAISLSKQDSNTANYLRDVLLNRGIPDAELRNIQTQTRAGLTAVSAAESKEAARRAEAERLAALRGDKPPIAAAPTAAPAGITANDAIQRVLQREGGFVDNPADRGGATNFGISQKAYPKLDIANLTEADAARIYKRDYWDRINADKLPANIREMAFDAAVNQGVSWTRKALRDSGNDPQKFLELRAQRYQDIVAGDPTQAQFLNGWMNRLNQFAAGVAEAVVPTAQAAAPAVAQAAPAAGVAPAAPAAARQMKSSDFYMGNPQAVSRDMQVALQNREELRRMAMMYRDAGLTNQYDAMRQQIMQLDQGLFYLSGMQGIQQLMSYRDPRMLSAVISQSTGVPTGIRPRTDNLYDIVANPGTENESLISQGVAAEQLGAYAQELFDPSIRAARTELAQFAAKEEIKGRAGTQQAMIKATADIQTAIVNGEYKKAEELAKQSKGELKFDTASGKWAFVKGNDVRIIDPSEQAVVETPLGPITRPPTARRITGLNFGQ